MTGRPLILVDPLPRTLPMICAPDVRARLEALGRLEVSDAAPMDPARVDALLPEAVALIGQTDLPAERIARAERLRVLINIEGNFLPNVDYAACRARGIHVLCASPAFADAVAESALGMAIDLARGIGAADRAIRREGAEPAALDDVLAGSRVVFVLAAATSDNAGFLGERELRLLPEGAVLALMSRAGVVDFDALVRAVAEGRIRAAVDVFPEEPLPAGHPLLGAHGSPASRVARAHATPRPRGLRQLLQGPPPPRPARDRMRSDRGRHLRRGPAHRRVRRAQPRPRDAPAP